MAQRRKATLDEPARQIAALPIKINVDGAIKVLMVTSRTTRRWVMPKGWTMDGKKPWKAAEIEALEEAGAVGFIGSDLLGTYTYDKTLEDGTTMPVVVELYPMMVERLRKRWKERRDRTRRWFSLTGAAKRVDEPELQAILRQLADKPRKKPGLRAILKKR
ncbi:MAG: NUDIX domain-containing protein [Pseudomonadota bacterium]